MNTYFKSLGWPLFALLIYLGVQAILSIPLGLALSFNPDLNAGLLMGIVLFLSSIITGLIIYLMKPFHLRDAFKQLGCPRSTAVLAIIATLFGLFASDIINEFLNLPNPLEKMFKDMTGNIWGVLAIAVFGPICEEIVFRGGIMKPMLMRGVNPWAAILTSAIVFGLIHGNPAQIPFAAMVGVIFGIVYYRTDSLIITTLCHILNNASSVLLMNTYQGNLDELSFQNLWGLPVTIACLVGSAAISVFLLICFWRRTAA